MDKHNKNPTGSDTRPVTILTGYLGAGKTTFLNSLMAANPDTRYAIIENEIGETGIDGQLITRRPDDFIELENGCLCCSLNGSLYDAIEQMHRQRDGFDELIIECTGLAMPGAVAEPFISHPVIKSVFPLKRMVCLVDAEIIEDQLEDRDEAMRQVTASDVIVINKTDLVHAGHVESLEQRLARLNPFAQVFVGQAGSFPMDRIGQVFYKPAPMVFHVSPNPGKGDTDRTLGRHTGHHRHGDVSSQSFEITEELDIVKLFLTLYSFFMVHGDTVYRMKGVLYERIPGKTKRTFVQSVGGRLGIEDGPPWGREEVPSNRLVFIGKGLDDLDIETMLHACLPQQDKTASSLQKKETEAGI
ncbi:CobW family GTP-binding protein [Parapedobacter koreensis]|uniref:GTPase, G3E family n=1 Tax=Parapedobacter koreensis TaxID=332977 RepID=A0A1H7ICM4_9SPHI|nr:GTP-binding protein [Parapedobacter koreensis]SEK60323.1 GTPase, G3E family [Parapedobacter koreensis]